MEIITYSNVQLLAGILQGIASLFGGEDYRGMLVVVACIGFMVALMGYAFQPQRLTGWYWMATVLLVSAGLVMPKTRVQLIDRLQNCAGGGCVTVVENVPFALAVLASITTRIGDTLAKSFEDTFGPIAINVPEGTLAPLSAFPDLNYRASGLMFGNKIVKETARVTFPGVNFRYNLVKYLDNCAGPDMSDGTVEPNDVHTSTDIWATLGGGGNAARFTPTAGGVVMSCAALRTQLDTGMGAEITAAMDTLGQRLNADALADGQALSSAGAQARVGSQVSQAYLRARLGGAGGDAATMIRQNAMINAMGDAAAMRSQRTNDPTSVMVGMAEAQAKVSTNTSWITGAKVAEEAMPLIRNGIEAILYAAFPIVVLMMLVVSGRTAVKLITSYASTLLWIQLWPVLFAVLNYMATAAAARHLSAAGAMPGGTSGVSLLTAASIYENSISDVAVVGYLVISIPVIAWSLVKGMEAIGAGALAGAGAFTGGSSVGAAQAATGNISSGVTRMDDVNLAPHYGSANYRTYEDGFSKRTDDMSSRNLDSGQLKQSDMGVSVSMVHRDAESRSLDATREAGVGSRLSSQADSMMNSAITDGLSLARTNSRTGTQTDGSGESTTTATGTTNRLRDGTIETNSVGSANRETHGKSAALTGTATTNIDKSVTGTVGGKVGISSPFGGVSAGIETAISGREGEGVTGSNSSQRAMSHDELAGSLTAAQNSATSDETRSRLRSLTQDSRFQTAVANGDAAAVSVNTAFSRSESLKHSSEEHFDQSQKLSSQARNMHENASSISVNMNNYAYEQMKGGVGDFATAQHHDPARAGQLMSDAAAPGIRSFGDAEYTAGYGQQAQPDPGRLDPDRVGAMEAEYRNGAPTSAGVDAHRAAAEGRVSGEIHDKHLSLQSAPGGGGGKGAARKQEMQRQWDEVGTQQTGIRSAAADVTTKAETRDMQTRPIVTPATGQIHLEGSAEKIHADKPPIEDPRDKK